MSFAYDTLSEYTIFIKNIVYNEPTHVKKYMFTLNAYSI